MRRLLTGLCCAAVVLGSASVGRSDEEDDNPKGKRMEKRFVIELRIDDEDGAVDIEHIMKQVHEALQKGFHGAATEDPLRTARREGHRHEPDADAHTRAHAVFVGPDGKARHLELGQGRTRIEGDGAHVIRKLDDDGQPGFWIGRLGEHAPEHLMWVMRGEDEDEPKYVLGIQLMPVDDTLREHLDLQEGDGLVVAGVLAESPAEKAGFQEHDVVIRVDGKDVESVEDIVKSVQTAGENEEELAVTVVRSGDRKTITVVPAKRKPSEHAEAEKHGSHEGHAKMSEDHERVLQQLREEIKELRGAIKELKRALHDDD